MTRQEWLTGQELAERFGRTVRTITNWTNAGMPQRLVNGQPRFDWRACLEWREQKIRSDQRGVRDAGGDASRQERMAEARLRRALAVAEQADLDLAERRAQLVTVDFMAEEFNRIATGLRSRLLAIPTAWEPRLATCTTSIDRQLALRELVNDLLPSLKDAVEDASVTCPECGAVVLAGDAAVSRSEPR